MARMTPGRWLQVVAGVLTAVGIGTYRQALAEIGRARLVDAVPDHGERATAFWFLAAGPALWLVGRLLRSAENAGDLEAQRSAGRVVTALGAVGSAAMPRSGFWAVVAVGLSALRRSRRR